MKYLGIKRNTHAFIVGKKFSVSHRQVKKGARKKEVSLKNSSEHNSRLG
jgi:hypothetical protein